MIRLTAAAQLASFLQSLIVFLVNVRGGFRSWTADSSRQGGGDGVPLSYRKDSQRLLGNRNVRHTAIADCEDSTGDDGAGWALSEIRGEKCTTDFQSVDWCWDRRTGSPSYGRSRHEN